MAENHALVTDFLYRKAVEKGIPIGGTFELTPVCNLNCKMCYVRMTPQEAAAAGGLRTKDEWLDLARQAMKMGLLNLQLTGGEPFLFPGFEELFCALREMGLLIALNTNATLLKGERLDWILKHAPNKVNITLYGASNETYLRCCGIEDGFDTVTAAIRALKNAGVYVKINASITQDNLCDMRAIYDTAAELNCPLQMGSYMFPPFKNERKTNRLSADESGRAEFDIDLMRFSPRDMLARSRQMLADSEKPNDGVIEKMRCRAGRSNFWVSFNGEMAACGMMRTQCVNPFETGFEAAWKQINSFWALKPVLSGCKGCEYANICPVCAGMAWLETGDMNGKPEYVCKMTQQKLRLTQEYIRCAEVSKE